MRVEYGINPNCSELVIRLNEWEIDSARKELEKNGFSEILVKDMYDIDHKEKPEWDDNANTEKFTFVKDIPENVVRLMRKANSHNDTIQNRAKEALKDLGYTDNWYDFNIIETGNLPDFENCSTVDLREDFDGDGPAIVAHQHCQTQLYPILYKISKIFGAEVNGYDGGSNDTYILWLDADRPNVKTWEPYPEE